MTATARKDDARAVERPPNGYAMSLYEALRISIPELQAAVASHRHWLAYYERSLAEATATLEWMRLHQADEIAAFEQERAERSVLIGRATGWPL